MQKNASMYDLLKGRAIWKKNKQVRYMANINHF